MKTSKATSRFACLVLALVFVLTSVKADAGQIELDWEPASGAVLYAVYYRRPYSTISNEQNWWRHGYTYDTKYIIETSLPGIYEVHVRSISITGQMSVWEEFGEFTILGAVRRVRTVVEETSDDGATWKVINQIETVIPK
jgi:predicted phage tail protein